MLIKQVVLKDDGTDDGSGQCRAVIRATSRHPVICPIVLTTEWPMTGQHGLTSRPFSCCWALVSYVDEMQHLLTVLGGVTWINKLQCWCFGSLLTRRDRRRDGICCN